jgi:hypothetical protein
MSRFNARRTIVLFALVAVAVAALAVTGCSRSEEKVGTVKITSYMKATDKAIASAVLPSYVTAASRDAYEFAVAHPEVLMYMPCYCGCGLTAGHKSNLDCFIKGIDEKGVIHFDRHGSGCTTCVDIARDARDLLAQGKSLTDIRDYIDKTHGKKGPGTDTLRPPA